MDRFLSRWGLTVAITCLSGCLKSAPLSTGDAGARADAGARTDAGSCEPRCPANLCGAIDDGCGGTITCGCPHPAECGAGGTPNLCAVPDAALACTDGFCRLSRYPAPMVATDLYATASDDVWGVGEAGAIRHYDGETWREIADIPDADLRAVWGSSPRDVWLVGDSGTLLHFDGTELSEVDGGQLDADLKGVWGLSEDAVWIVGDGLSARFDGVEWSAAAATTPSLTHVFAANADAVWATGENALWHLQGEQWVRVEPPESEKETLTGIFGRSPDEIFAVGYTTACPLLRPCDDDELVLEWDGQSWTSIDTVVEGPVAHVYGSTSQVVALRDHDLHVLAGQGSLPAPPAGTHLGAQTAVDEQFLLTRGGEPFALAGDRWQSGGFGREIRFASLSVVDDTIWAGGRRAVVEWRGGLVTHRLTDHGASFEPVVSISGTNPSDVWAVDLNERFWSDRLWHWDGATWQIRDMPNRLTAFYEVVAVAESDVYVIGEQIFRGDGETWTEIPANGTWHGAALDESGSLWVVGARGTDRHDPTAVIAREQNGDLVDVQTVTGLEVACAVHAASDADIWVAGYLVEDATLGDYRGAVAHWDGAEWTVTMLGDAGRLCSLAVAAPDDIYVAGDGLFHFDGGTWSERDVLRAGKVQEVAVADDGVWAAGDLGQLLFQPIE